MKFFKMGFKWRGLLAAAILGVLVIGGVVLLPDAEAQGGFFVESTDPADGAIVREFPTSITLNFNGNVFGPGGDGDLVVGGLPSTAVTQVGDSLVFTVDPAANIGPGPYQVTLPGDVIFGGSEVGNDPYTGSFTFAPTGSIAVIKQATPSDGTDFAFSFTGPNADHNLTLDDDDNTNGNRADNFRIGLLDAGDYDITEVLPPSWELASIDCGVAGFEEISDNAGLIGATVSLGQGDDVTCTFLNNQPLVTVCLVKIVGQTGNRLMNPDDSRFDVVVNDSPLQGQLQPTGNNQECPAPQGGGTASFDVVPGSTFTIIEADTTVGVGPTDIFCSVSQNQANSRGVNGDLDDRSITVDLDPSENKVECTFMNDSIAICVTKDIAAGAAALNASPTDFTFRLDDGAPQQLGPECAQADAPALFLVAPGSSATIGEVLTDDSPIRPVSIVCSQVVPTDGGTEMRFFGTANLAQASISIDTSSAEQGLQIDCVFTNDAVIVCVVKDIDLDLQRQTTASSFTFQLTASGQASMALVPGPATELCPNRLREGQAVAGVALAPGTMFSLSEEDPGFTSGLVAAECRIGIEGPLLAELDVSTLASRTLENIEAPAGESRIECRFDNESVLVCVVKQIGLDASGAGFTNSGTFTATINGESTGQTLTPETPDGDNPCDAGTDYFQFYVAPSSTVILTETLPSGSPLGLVSAECASIADGPNPIATSLTGQTVSFEAGSDRVSCTFVNDMRVVCVTKTVLAGAQAAGYNASDFGFAVTFDGEVAPEVPESCQNEVAENQAVRGFAYRPGSAQVTVQEVNNSSNPLPYGLESALCVAGESEPVVSESGSDSVTFADANVPTECEFRNDTLIVCVTKEVGAVAVAAGFSASDFGFTVVDGDLSVEPFSTDCVEKNTDTTASYAYALTPESAGTFTVTETPTAADARVGLVSANCVAGLTSPTTDLDARTVVASKEHGGDSVVKCRFVNDSVAVTIAKTLTTDDGVVASVGDFLFDVFDSQGAELETGLAADAVFYVAPGSTFVISERAAPGFTTTASCSDIDVAAGQALPTAASVTHTPGEFVADVVCTFVNDDVPPIPVCAILFLGEGTGDFTLADFTFELFLNGAIVGQARADADAGGNCPDADLVPITEVFADGSTFSITVSAQDPGELLVFEPPSCSVDVPAALQTLRGSEIATFTAEVGARHVICVARVTAAAPAFVRQPVQPRAITPVIEEAPVVAAAPAAAPPAQVVSSSIAVTGTSTTGVTLPAGLALFAIGFLVLALERRDRTRRGQ